MALSRTTAGALACLALAYAPCAWAAPTESELATARQLFTEGVALEDARDWAAALDRFRRVAAIKSTPQVRYNLGVCLAGTGRLVEAIDELSPVADKTGEASLVELAALAKQKLAAIRPRVPTVLVRLTPGADAAVTLDGTVVSPALLGTPILVDPGPHTLVAERRSGRGRLEERLVAVEGDKQPLFATFDFPPDTAAPESARPHPTIPLGSLVAGGSTVVVLASALVFTVLRGAAIADLNAKCGPGHQYCPPSLHGKVTDVTTYTVAADTLGILGLVGAGVTASFFFLPSSPATQAHAGPAVGLAASGKF